MNLLYTNFIRSVPLRFAMNRIPYQLFILRLLVVMNFIPHELLLANFFSYEPYVFELMSGKPASSNIILMRLVAS